MRRVVLVLGLVGCVTNHELVVTVTDTRDAPVAHAVVGAVCTTSGDAAAVTDADGVAVLVIYNASPERCTITVAAAGYLTHQLVSDAAALDVVLEASP